MQMQRENKLQRENIEVAGENALWKYDAAAYNKCQPWHLQEWPAKSEYIWDENNFKLFKTFVKKFEANQLTSIYTKT